MIWEDNTSLWGDYHILWEGMPIAVEEQIPSFVNMKFRDALREIGKRLGDPDLRKYKGLVRQCFVDSMAKMLYEEEGFNLVEIPDLIKEVEHTIDVPNGQGQVDIPALARSGSVIRMVDVFQRPQEDLNNSVTLKEIPYSEYKRMQLEVSFRPARKEVFWFRRGNIIYVVASELVAELSDLTLIFQFIENPDPGDWTGSVDLIADLNYSRNFLYRVIGSTVENISGLPAFAGQPAQPAQGAYEA
mgnify:FL=1|jgi:hypothetical protein|tara:strand:+ start:222 stop:953 length:732 start_codon:yes stop_codon:yes gene_type:complete